MYTRKIPRDLSCGLAVTMEVMGNKWKPCLLFNIYKGINRPGQLQQHNPQASRQVLSQQLKELEAHGIIQKTIYPEIPLKVEYSLTRIGQTLIPLLETILAWGETYKDEMAFSQPIIDLFRAFPKL